MLLIQVQHYPRAATLLCPLRYTSAALLRLRSSLRQVSARSFNPNDGRIIMPGQDRNRSQPGRIIMPGQMQQPSNPSNQTGPGNFASIGQDVAGSSVQAPPRNFRPPTGFMNEDGPEQDIYSGKTTDELIMMLKTRSDYWYNLAKIFPKLYNAGFDRASLTEITNVDPARQNVWNVASEVYHSLKESLTAEQCSYFQYEESSPDCLMELRFLDSGRRVEGAQYIADQQLSADMATVLARAIKDQQRRGEAAAGFSGAAGDCLAFKYYRDAQECRNMKERQQFIDKGMGVAVTDSARAVLQELEAAPENKLPSLEEKVAGLEVARMQKEETGARPMPVLGSYGQVTPDAMDRVWQLQGSGMFQIVTVPEESGQLVVLPRWNVLALAARPAVLMIDEVSSVPEVTQGKTTTYKGPGLLVVDAADRTPERSSFYLADVDGALKLVPGSEVQQPLGKALIVCLHPRSNLASISPDAFDL